jgi:ethanolamine ammonia-lyase large subunit
VRAIEDLAAEQAGEFDVQIVISDGLDALALTDPGHLLPYLDTVVPRLAAAGYKVAAEHHRARPAACAPATSAARSCTAGSPTPRHAPSCTSSASAPAPVHRAYSVYITAPPATKWANPGAVDHDITRVIAGIADTSLDPTLAAEQTVEMLRQLAPT